MVTWAVGHRLLDNLVDNSFSPANPITRQEMAFMFYQFETRYSQRTARNLSSLTRFSDWRDIHLYARNAMRWSIGNVLIRPVSGNALQPTAYATRAQLETALRQYKTLH